MDGLFGNYGVTWRRKYPGYSEAELLTLPRVTTETGVTIEGVITEEIQACLYLSVYLDQFKRGWRHTAIYLLRDRTDESGQPKLWLLQARLHAAIGGDISPQPDDDPGTDKASESPSRQTDYSIPRPASDRS